MLGTVRGRDLGGGVSGDFGNHPEGHAFMTAGDDRPAAREQDGLVARAVVWVDAQAVFAGREFAEMINPNGIGNGRCQPGVRSRLAGRPRGVLHK